MNRKMYQIAPSGQLVEVQITESVVVNPDQILNVLKTGVNTPEDPEALNQVSELDCYYNLGDGVCAFQREFGGIMRTFGAVMLSQIPFYTRWTLTEEGNKHVLIPNNGREDLVEIGAPMMLPVPEDLIIHFVVEWKHNKQFNIIKPDPGHVYQLPELLQGNVGNCYLTGFSRTRNTCVRLPLPNLYDDARLCTGSSFANNYFRDKRNHWGLTTSIKTYAKCWGDSGWNLDLLNGRTSRRMNQYRRFVRFNADTGKAMPFLGCKDWAMSTSPVPLAEMYSPWTSNEKPSMPEAYEGEENLPEGGEEIGEAPRPVMGGMNAEPAVDMAAAFQNAGGPGNG